MVKFSRRQFLQAAGAAFTTWGLHHWQLAKTQRVLAQPTNRKLALLVGINDYSNPSERLAGCVNDVILQRQLLIHRYGFNPQDVVMLLDEQATRQGMLEAFEEHLIKQAKPGDVVVYHYSGHGSLVQDPDPIFRRVGTDIGLNGTFVPVDAKLPTGYPETGGTVADIMGHTLFLLMSAIQTENFTAVLDSCFSGAATRDFRVRSRDGGEKIQIAPQEKAYQEQWLSRLDWSEEEYIQRYRQGVANGVVLASTQRHQYAVDEPFSGFAAGAFTFRFTQHLWQNNSTPKSAIAAINQQLPRRYNQNPLWEVEVNTNNEEKPLFFVENPGPVAHGRVIETQGRQAQVLLVGLHPGQVEPGLELVAANGGKVRLFGREGLIAVGEVSGSITAGELLLIAP
ncbi:caspase family protein [Spirulina sp. CS-785/01]|uniref:caspase family protein n=1 Tax=Spirulina sp. CS-785/01 TaxID=3021716 RepID=UPI00233066A6|nr:caspase family protein [Spirulina sp. CS-785/01]MDB9313500.1 caspase family protein [Spirulina sp. CS-785/01]